MGSNGSADLHMRFDEHRIALLTQAEDDSR